MGSILSTQGKKNSPSPRNTTNPFLKVGAAPSFVLVDVNQGGVNVDHQRTLSADSIRW